MASNNTQDDNLNRLLLSCQTTESCLTFKIIKRFKEFELIAGPERNAYCIDSNLEEFKDSYFYLHYLLAPLVLCEHPFYNLSSKNNEEYFHGQKIYEDLLFNSSRSSFLTTFRQHKRYLDYLFWKIFLPIKGKGDIFKHRSVPSEDVDLPRNYNDHIEFTQYYLPSILESEISDIEQVLLAIRKKKYVLTKSEYEHIVETVSEGRKRKQIYLHYLIERQKQRRMDQRFLRSLHELQSTSPDMLVHTILEMIGDAVPVYNLRKRVVERNDSRY